MPTLRQLPAVAGTTCQSQVVHGRYRSIQVNVNRRGCNIVGDAANEPSISVDPTNPRKIVIGWRQFDTVESDFRQAGWAYSHDGGHTWVFTGSLMPGVFGSDPVLAAGPSGEIYYLSINFDEMRLFRSFDSAVTWATRVQVSPGFLDKPWMAVDQTYGIGRGNIYITSPSTHTLVRSNDGGETWVSVLTTVGGAGTLATGTEGTLYGMFGAYFTRSDNVHNPEQAATWAILDTDFGSTSQSLRTYWCGDTARGNPNNSGLTFQPWVAEGYSPVDNHRKVYVVTLGGFDPLCNDPGDIVFLQSADGGASWSRPVVVNDDPPKRNAWQWFGMMSVAPNGRIDVVWNDTRNHLDAPNANLSELYYASSTDGGETWLPNVQVSPVFDSHVGYPVGSGKLGDYYHMIADNLGVNVAYAATFNGEQDVYFLRIGPWDCNGNEVPDEDDIAATRSRDCNGNTVPDECEYRADADGDGVTTLTDFGTFVGDFLGPTASPACACGELSDADHDGDVDLHDFYLLEHVFDAR